MYEDCTWSSPMVSEICDLEDSWAKRDHLFLTNICYNWIYILTYLYIIYIYIHTYLQDRKNYILYIKCNVLLPALSNNNFTDIFYFLCLKFQRSLKLWNNLLHYISYTIYDMERQKSWVNDIHERFKRKTKLSNVTFMFHQEKLHFLTPWYIRMKITTPKQLHIANLQISKNSYTLNQNT